MRSHSAPPEPVEHGARKNVAAWRAYNHRRWDAEKNLLPADATTPFVCECSSSDCLMPLELTILEYEAAHMCPTWCAVLPDHTMPGDLARVLVRHPHFWVVELLTSAPPND